MIPAFNPDAVPTGPPRVSIVILNYKHPEIIDVCLRQLQMTQGVTYEVIVVDNGSGDDDVTLLKRYVQEGKITTLVPSPVNTYFSGGNNLGVAHTNPESEFILLLNSDVAVLHPDWLVKLIAWMEGTIEYRPSVWGLNPTKPNPGPRDIVSAGWSHDVTVIPSMARPEGFCCMFRRTVWRDLSTDFPWYYGFEEACANAVRDGAKCGVLSQYPPYLIHREGASGKIVDGTIIDARVSNIAEWFRGLYIETLDFTLGPDEHSSYISW